MSNNREWMYRRLNNGFITKEYLIGVEEFVDFAKMHPSCMSSEMLHCPCNHRKCRNKAYHDEETVKVHICRYGFVPDYYSWYHHGEPYIATEITYPVGLSSSSTLDLPQMHGMVNDAYNSLNIGNDPQSPNQAAKTLYDMLRASEAEVWEGNPFGHSQLSAVARLLNIKAQHHISERCYDEIYQLMSELLPSENLMTNSFYDTKKLIKGLGLPMNKIDCCNNNCMIFWGEDSELNECRFCEHPRYKPTRRGSSKKKKNVPWKQMYYFLLTPRLQRLYASEETAKHMRWHYDHVKDGNTMCHPSDSPAWKHFDATYPSFAAEVRNVRLGLSADGFNPSDSQVNNIRRGQ